MNEFLKKLDTWVDAHREEMISDITELVAIPSKRGEAAENAPYGVECARSIDAAMAMCEKYGFATKNYDYHACTADMNDKAPCLDILAHLDVVAEGSGWDTDPYTVVEKDGWLYGRGTADDKGPAVVALYAMRAVRDLGIPLNGNVRLILGSDEECGSSDLKHYFSIEKSAPNSVSPDIEYPVYNTEKGRFRPSFTCALTGETGLPRVASIAGGSTGNIVPEKASAVVLGLDTAEAEKLVAETAAACSVTCQVAPAEGGCQLTVLGKSAHGSTPEKGINANTGLIAILNALPLAEENSTATLKKLGDLFPHGDGRGNAIGIAMEDEASGHLSMAFTVLKLENGELSGLLDCRTPICCGKENCYDIAEQKLTAAGFCYSAGIVAPHHVPADSPFVQTLLNAYETVTGEKGQCMATGGGTYVHDIEGGVAFGPVMPGCPTNIHGANEKAPIADLLASIKIFALIIADVCK